MEENLKSIRSCVYAKEKNQDVKRAIDLTEVALCQMIEAQLSGDSKKVSAAAWSVRSAAESAAWSARSAAFNKYADKLLELMRECF